MPIAHWGCHGRDEHGQVREGEKKVRFVRLLQNSQCPRCHDTFIEEVEEQDSGPYVFLGGKEQRERDVTVDVEF